MVNKNSEYFIIEKNIELIENSLVSLSKEIESLRKLYIRHFLNEDLKRLTKKEKEWKFYIEELKYWKNKKIAHDLNYK